MAQDLFRCNLVEYVGKIATPDINFHPKQCFSIANTHHYFGKVVPEQIGVGYIQTTFHEKKCSNDDKTEEGQRDLGRRMWSTGWGKVSGEWDKQQKIG